MALELMIIALFILLPNTLCQPLGSQCPGSRYPDNSTFQSNLQALLSTLNSNSIRSTFNASVAGADSPDGVYGLYFCTADLPQPICHNCIATAASDILQLCPTNRQGVVWYNYCQLRYSDQPFFGLADPTGFRGVMSGPNISDPARPLEILSELVEEASKGRPSMFAYDASLWEGMYAMAQCSGDLNASGCAACLETVLEKAKMCCVQASAWSYLAYSCRVRFDVTPFLRNIDLSNQMVGYKCTGNISTDFDMVTLARALAIGASPTGFYNTSVTSNGSRLYGLALCRGDIDSHTCGKCLNKSATDLTKNCVGRMGGMVWCEKCSIRLANWDFFGVVDEDARVFCNRSEGIGRDDKSIKHLMSRLVELVADKPSMYAQGSMSISGSLIGFGSAQCSRDLSSEACSRSLLEGLRNGLSQCKRGKGWGYFSGSCSLRYEKYAFFEGGGELLYRLPKLKIRGKILTIMVVAIAAVVFLLVLATSIYILSRKKFSGSKGEEWICSALLTDTNKSILINMETLQAATNNFSDANKLGEGGFGHVYKGQLPDGKEIAVKRLSPASSQGDKEFKNEIRLIAKLQHRNLVRMLGCCIKGEEKLLVYEYLPNGSLDSFLFDPHRRSLLDWRARRHIIFGIARGLVYLHEESLLKVVHRDLKASNMLLDLKMNVKIADFGMAKIFKLDENEAHTRKVVGTYLQNPTRGIG